MVGGREREGAALAPSGRQAGRQAGMAMEGSNRRETAGSRSALASLLPPP